MGTSARIQCRWCNKICSIAILKRDHGEVKPRCVGERWINKLTELGWRGAGSYTALLSEVGLVKRIPLWIWYRIPVDKDGNELGSWADESYAQTVTTEMVSFTSCTPVWAYDLARKLSRDKGLARKLGFTQKRELVKEYKVTTRKTALGRGTIHTKEVVAKRWQACDLDKQLPMHLRVRIMRVAANNELARELIFDDPEAAGRIIKDIL